MLPSKKTKCMKHLAHMQSFTIRHNIEWNLMKRRHFFTSVKTLRFETKVVQKSEFGPYALTKR